MADKGRCIDCKDYTTCGLRSRPMLVVPPRDWVAEFQRIQREARESKPACSEGAR